MSVQERIKTCQLINKMKDNKEYSMVLGLEDKSSFHGCMVENTIELERGNNQ